MSKQPFLKKIRTIFWRGLLIASIIGVVAAASLILFLEVRHNSNIELPAPNGPYAVGRVLYDWTDYSRSEIFANKPGTHRELLVWIWYPALHPAGAQTAPYLPPQWAQAVHPGLSGVLWQNDATVHTHAVDHAPISPAFSKYPVLIFEPGLGNLPTDYTAMIEDIVSHGYVVAAITPSYSSDVVIFPNGHVISAAPAARLEANADGTISDQESNQLITVWTKDVSFTIDQLQALDTTSSTLFTGHLNLNSIGVFGHSFGGAVALEVCRIDIRCKAGINIDGSLIASTQQVGLTRPFMIILHDHSPCSEISCLSSNGIHTALSNVPPQERYILTIKGTDHFNFSDYPLINTPAAFLGALGSINGQRGLQITETYIEAFFATYLAHMASPLLHGSAKAYPEVQFFPYT